MPLLFPFAAAAFFKALTASKARVVLNHGLTTTGATTTHAHGNNAIISATREEFKEQVKDKLEEEAKDTVFDNNDSNND